MIDRALFVEGLNRVAFSVQQVVDAATQGVYFDVFTRRMDDQEWDRFTRWCAESTPWVSEPRYRRFPSVPELQEALRIFRGERPALAEATEAYERVIAAGVYTPEGGTSWTFRGVKEACGEAAAEAFLAAGGTAAFASTGNADRRRERFVAAYAETVREDPETKLLPAQAALPAAVELGQIGREEARRLVERIAGEAGLPDPRPPGPAMVVLTPEREVTLREQAARILAEEPAVIVEPIE